ncbi:phosphoglycolate phosphatase [Mytilus galloprovincialis]|uniref:Phosphoglycolate phosphatase n=1 Tax=Mytilus galloprovincialis TaxID=29158 RepID=A0A8B6DLM6_MYTGA|nr:phosphoglycolate phosphatase [Mytilus galloprovincialis]
MDRSSGFYRGQRHISVVIRRVLWEASKEIPGSADTIAALRKLGKKIFYITNNSGKTRSQYVQKCKSLGFHAAEEDVICTGHAAAQYINAQNLKGKVYCVGNTSMGVELDSFGIKHFGIGPDEVPGSIEQIGIQQHVNLDPEVSKNSFYIIHEHNILENMFYSYMITSPGKMLSINMALQKP